MSEIKQNQQQIQPGMCPIDPETGLPTCPPPDRIECIVVEKVYDSCFQCDTKSKDDIEIDFNPGGGGEHWEGPFSVGDAIECEPELVQCQELNRVPIGDNLFNVTLLITVPVVLTNPNNDEETESTTFTFVKTVTLCAPQPTNVNCDESFVVNCNCIVIDVVANPQENVGTITVSCTITVCLVFKSTLFVQLLVPSYGFCVAEECSSQQVCTGCPPSPPAQCDTDTSGSCCCRN